MFEKLQIERVRQLNSLDEELLEFARKLLQERFQLLKRRDPHFRQNWLRMVHPLKSERIDGNSLV